MKKILAFGSRLSKCRNVLTLGVKTNFTDYNIDERKMIAAANTIYYPSSFYVALFKAHGKKVFPSYYNYDCAQDKIKQTSLFHISGLPHPRTRFFYGARQKHKILDYFKYPFIAKIPRGSASGRGVFMIRNYQNLKKYLECTHVAYIQEYLPIDRDIRVVVVGNNIIHAYWRIMKDGEFRSNVALGGCINFASVPHKALRLALTASIKCGWNDVGIDICQYKEKMYILEANMNYGREGFTLAGINYFKLMEDIIESGFI